MDAKRPREIHRNEETGQRREVDKHVWAKKSCLIEGVTQQIR